MNLLLMSMLVWAQTCPVGDIKACQDYLKVKHKTLKAQQFADAYDVICSENKTFSCVKLTVRDDLDAVMKDQAEKRGDKSALYTVKFETEDFIYILAKKIEPKK